MFYVWLRILLQIIRTQEAYAPGAPEAWSTAEISQKHTSLGCMLLELLKHDWRPKPHRSIHLWGLTKFHYILLPYCSRHHTLVIGNFCETYAYTYNFSSWSYYVLLSWSGWSTVAFSLRSCSFVFFFSLLYFGFLPPFAVLINTSLNNVAKVTYLQYHNLPQHFFVFHIKLDFEKSNILAWLW